MVGQVNTMMWVMTSLMEKYSLVQNMSKEKLTKQEKRFLSELKGILLRYDIFYICGEDEDSELYIRGNDTDEINMFVEWDWENKSLTARK